MMEDFDHVAHHNNDLQSHVFVLKHMDAVIGQVWTAIQKSPLADQTAFVLFQITELTQTRRFTVRVTTS